MTSSTICDLTAPVKTLAIAIPSRNRPEDIRRCITSIVAQATPPAQLIVVDQSTPKYDLPLIPYLEHVHNMSLRGLPAARNRCIERVRSDAVLFLDDDSELLSDCVPAVIEGFNVHADAVGLECNITSSSNITWKTRAMQTIFAHGFFNQRSINRRDGIQLRTLSGCAMAFRSSLLRVETFDERLNDYAIGEDWEFAKRAQRHGTLWRIQNARVHHHVAAVNRYRVERLLQERCANFVYFYKKCGGDSDIGNRLSLTWWLTGQSLLALRLGVNPRSLWSGRSDAQE